MADRRSVARLLLAIARNGVDDAALAAQICQACVDGLDVDGAAISLQTATSARATLCATDATARRMEELQFTLGEGACMQAARTGRAVLMEDVRGDAVHSNRWPMFAAAVAEQSDVGALFALPLQIGTITLGVLDLYRRAPGPLDSSELIEAMRAADTAAMMLLGLRTETGEQQWLDSSWTGFTEVHQATGMIMAQLGVGAQEAFTRLRAHAFAEEQLLREVARDVVARQVRFTRDTT